VSVSRDGPADETQEVGDKLVASRTRVSRRFAAVAGIGRNILNFGTGQVAGMETAEAEGCSKLKEWSACLHRWLSRKVGDNLHRSVAGGGWVSLWSGQSSQCMAEKLASAALVRRVFPDKLDAGDGPS